MLPPCCCLHSTPSPPTPTKNAQKSLCENLQHFPTFTFQTHILLCCSIPCPFYSHFPQPFTVQLTIIFKGLIYLFQFIMFQTMPNSCRWRQQVLPLPNCRVWQVRILLAVRILKILRQSCNYEWWKLLGRSMVSAWSNTTGFIGTGQVGETWPLRLWLLWFSMKMLLQSSHKEHQKNVNLDVNIVWNWK